MRRQGIIPGTHEQHSIPAIPQLKLGPSTLAPSSPPLAAAEQIRPEQGKDEEQFPLHVHRDLMTVFAQERCLSSKLRLMCLIKLPCLTKPSVRSARRKPHSFEYQFWSREDFREWDEYLLFVHSGITA